MDLKEYQQNAIRTESRIEKLEFNREFITLLLELFMMNSEILDAIKKEVYYKNSKKFNEQILLLLRNMENVIKDARINFSKKNQHDQNINLNPRVFHGILGIATEAGELIQILISNLLSGKEVDAVNLHEELGDVNWYQAILHDCLDLNWGEGLERNIAKLRTRYPEKFTFDNANNRDLDAERKVLEGK